MVGLRKLAVEPLFNGIDVNIVKKWREGKMEQIRIYFDAQIPRPSSKNTSKK